MPGSNRRPLPCEGSALPAAPIAHVGFAVTRGDRGLDTSRRNRPNAHRGGARTLRRPPAGGAVSTRHARVSGPESANDRGERATRSAQFVIRSPNPLESLCTQKCEQRGCGAVVAHHLAKVRVASSNLVIRSDQDRAQARFLFFWWRTQTRWIGREARQRPAKPYTRVRIPYPPPS